MSAQNLLIRLAVSGAAQVQGALGGIRTTLGQLNGAVGGVGGAFAALGVGLSAGAVLGKLVAVQREFDVLSSSLKTVTGSSAAAAREMEWIKAFAKETPFGLSQATQAFVKMKALGLDPSREALTSYGNTASALGKDLNQMIEAVADAATGEFERLKEFGIKASKEGDQVKLTFQGVTTTIGNNAAEINGYLEKLGNNEFAGAMALRAATLDGAIASLGDTWDELFRTVNEQNAGGFIFDSVKLAEGAITDLISIITALNGTAADNARQTGAMATVQEGLATVFETVAVMGANVKYVLVQIGNELGGLAAQAVAVATGQFAQAREIGVMIKADAQAARKEVDATASRVLNARKIAALGAPNSYDEPAVVRARAAAAKAEADAKAKASAVVVAASAARSRAATGASAATKIASEAAKKAIQEQGEHTKWLQSMETDADAHRQKVFQARMDEHDKLLTAAREADAALAAQYASAATSAQQRLQDLNEEAEAMAFAEINQVSMAVAVEQTTIARLKEKQVGAMGNEAVVLALQTEIEARQKIVGLIASNDGKEASKKAAADAAADWQKTADSINQSLTDALMRGFESGKDFAGNLRDTLINMFKTLVLRPTISAILGPVAGAFGGVASAATGVGSAGSTLSAANSAYNAVTSLFSSTGIANAIGSSIANATGSGISGLLATNGAYGTAAGTAGSIGTAFAAVAPWLLGATAVAALWQPLFGRKLKDTGVQGEFSSSGFAGENYRDMKGGVFRSDKTTTSALDSELQKALSTQYTLLADGTKGMASQLGLSAKALETYTRKVRFSTRGLTDEQVVAKLQEEFGLLADELASTVLGTKEYTRTGEVASATLARLSVSLTAANEMFDVLGRDLYGVGLVGADMASQLADNFGGLDKMVQASTTYYQAFYSDAERAATATRTLTERLADLGYGLPEANAQFRSMVSGLDLTTESGRKTYAALLALSPEFSALQVELQRLADETAAKLIATFTARGQLVPALDAGALGFLSLTTKARDASDGLGAASFQAGQLAGGAANLNHWLWVAKDQTGALAGGAWQLSGQLDSTRVLAAALATGMSGLGVQQLLVQASTGKLSSSLTDTEVKALALATGLTEAQIRAGAASGSTNTLAAALSWAHFEASHAAGSTGAMAGALSVANFQAGALAGGAANLNHWLWVTKDQTGVFAESLSGASAQALQASRGAGAMAEALSGATGQAGQLASGAANLNHWMWVAKDQTSGLADGTWKLSDRFGAARLLAAELATGMNSLSVKQLLVDASTGKLTSSLTDTEVKALALATGLTEAQVRAGAAAGSTHLMVDALRSATGQSDQLAVKAHEAANGLWSATGQAGALAGSAQNLNHWLWTAKEQTGALAGGAENLTHWLWTAKDQTGALAGSLSSANAQAGALTTSQHNLAYTSWVASTQANGLAGSQDNLAHILAVAAARAMGFSGEVNTIQRLLGDASSGVLVFGDRVSFATRELDPAQAAVQGLYGQIFNLRSAADGTVVNLAGLGQALATVDTRTFVSTVVSVFELIGNRIKGVLGNITDERVAVREAAIDILGPTGMTAAQISEQVRRSMVGMPSNAGVVAAQNTLAEVDKQNNERAAGVASSTAWMSRAVDASKLRLAAIAVERQANAAHKDAMDAMLIDLSDNRETTEKYRLIAEATAARDTNLRNIASLDGEAGQVNASVAAQTAVMQANTAWEKWARETTTAAATDGARKAQLDYTASLQKYSLDASKAVVQLGRLRGETVKYYESQKQLAELMTGAASSLRQTVADFWFDRLDPMAQFNDLQSRYNVAYSMAMSTTGETLAEYAKEMDSLLRPMLDKAEEAGVGGQGFADLVNVMVARAEAAAKRLDEYAPRDYALESLGLLGQIDSTLAALEEGAMTADQLIVGAINAGKDTTRDGLRAVVAALTGQAVPAFASGGYHTGGLRLVGENGPELEVTGPSRIYNAGDTARMLRPGSAGEGNAALVQELQALRAEVSAQRREMGALQMQIVTNTGKSARQMDRWDVEGLPVRNAEGETLQTAAA